MGGGVGSGCRGGGMPGGVRGHWYQATSKIQARELEIVKSVDLNSKNGTNCINREGVTFH